MRITADLLLKVARAICSSRTCEGISCCQQPANGGKHGDYNRTRRKCPVDEGGFDDAAMAAIQAIADYSKAKQEPQTHDDHHDQRKAD